MNKSDKIIAASALAGLEMDIGGKKTWTEGDMTTVAVYERPCLRIDRNKGQITVYADTMCSRKSTRLMNTVLRHASGASVESHSGRWFLRRETGGRREEFTGNDITLTTRQAFIG